MNGITAKNETCEMWLEMVPTPSLKSSQIEHAVLVVILKNHKYLTKKRTKNQKTEKSREEKIQLKISQKPKNEFFLKKILTVKKISI